MSEVVATTEIVFTSLPSSEVFVDVAETSLLPGARSGQVFIDTGTTQAGQTRRLAGLFAEKGACLLDAPVSGGGQGAAAGMLHIFVGGDKAVFDAHKHLFEILGDPERVVYCGPSGCGQIVKGVNQLAMGLGDVAFLEAIAFAVRAGVDPLILAQGIGGPDPWRRQFEHMARLVAEGRGEIVCGKLPELPYFLNEAKRRGFGLPLTQALHAFCAQGEPGWKDNMGRPYVSFWHRLMQRCAAQERDEGVVQGP